ncbi:ribonuclease BN [gamma proteobacterium HTCC5015]|nr:ribonuclease BN [gamma proteobacterium HTCC5015]
MENKTLNAPVARWLWQEKHLELQSPAKRLGLGTLRYLYVLIDDIAGGQLTMRAMSLVYTTLLSIVPLLAVSFSVLKAFGVHNKQLEPLMLQFLEPLGQQGVEITSKVIGFIDNIDIGVLGVFGVVLLFYTAISLVQKIEATFNFVWRLQESRSLGRRFTDYGSVMLIGPLLVFSAIGMSAKVLNDEIVRSATEVALVGDLVNLGTRALPYLMIMAAFSFFYVFIPNTRVKLKAGIIAGVISGFLWQSLGWAFGSFIVSSTDNSTYAIYSGFAILIIFMMWIYISWLILLIGGSIAFYIQHPEYVVPVGREGGLSNNQRERIALQIMAIIAERHYKNHPPMNANQFVNRLHIQIQAVQEVLEALEDAGLVVDNGDNPPLYLPGVPLEATPAWRVIEVVRSAGEMPSIFHKRTRTVGDVDNTIDTLLHAQQHALDGVSIKDLADIEG